jgi:hypothetical protein
MNQDTSKASVSRPERFISHALVEVRPYKWLPFFIQSGILLDMSSAGFKVELTSSTSSAKKGEKYWLRIPLSPLGLRGMGDLECQVEIKWLEPSAARIGGVFLELEPRSQLMISQIVARLSEQGNKI